MTDRLVDDVTPSQRDPLVLGASSPMGLPYGGRPLRNVATFPEVIQDMRAALAGDPLAADLEHQLQKRNIKV